MYGDIDYKTMSNDSSNNSNNNASEDIETGYANTTAATTQQPGGGSTSMMLDENDHVVVAPSVSNQPLISVRYFSWQSRDFRELIACAAFAIVCLLTVMIPMTPNQRTIPYQLINDNEYIRNLTYDQILESEAVPDKVAVVLALVLPLCVQMLTARFFGLAGDMHRTFCIYLVAFAITMSTTELVKNYVGYLRPIFYEKCEPNEDYTACTSSDTNDVRKSFPSGHASSSFCGLLLLYVTNELEKVNECEWYSSSAHKCFSYSFPISHLSKRTLYLHYRFGVPGYKSAGTSALKPYTEDPRFYRLASIVSLLPMILAVFIAASRVHDNKHHPADVVGGALLGGSVANYVHGLWI